MNLIPAVFALAVATASYFMWIQILCTCCIMLHHVASCCILYNYFIIWCAMGCHMLSCMVLPARPWCWSTAPMPSTVKPRYRAGMPWKLCNANDLRGVSWCIPQAADPSDWDFVMWGKRLLTCTKTAWWRRTRFIFLIQTWNEHVGKSMGRRTFLSQFDKQQLI